MTGIPEASNALNQAIEVLSSSLGGCKEIESSYNHTHDLGEQVLESLQLTVKGLAEYLSHVAKIGTTTDNIVDTYTESYDVLTSAGLAQHKDGNRITEDLKDLVREAGYFKNDTVDPTLRTLGQEYGILHVLKGIVPIVKSSVEEFEGEWSTHENFAAGISTAIKDCQTMRDNL